MWALFIFPSQCPCFKCRQAAPSGKRVCAPDSLDTLSPGRASPSVAGCTPESSASALKGHLRPAPYVAPTPAGGPWAGLPWPLSPGGQGAGFPLGRAASPLHPRPRGSRALGRVLCPSALGGIRGSQRHWHCRGVCRSRDAAFPRTPARPRPDQRSRCAPECPGWHRGKQSTLAAVLRWKHKPFQHLLFV